MMAIKPILFNTEMVQAILQGRKTQTRRIAFKHDDLREFKSSTYPDGWWYKGRAYKSFDDFLHDPQRLKCRYKPGDVLWVRETWGENPAFGIQYRADWSDGACPYMECDDKWRPSIHMPKEAARIFLRVKDVRVERLDDMREEDAMAEGFADSSAGTYSPLERFSILWDKTIKREDLREYGWHANPWVWTITFERCERPEGWLD